MKFKKLAVVLLVSVLGLSAVQAQEVGKASSRFNIHTNPVMWLAGIYSLGVDVSVSDRLTLGGSYNLITFENLEFYNGDIDAKAKGADLRIQYFFNEVFKSGWYFSGFGGFNSGEVEDTSNGDFAKFKVKSLGVTAGYFWRWDHFNIQLGLGVQRSSVDMGSSTLSQQDIQDIEDLKGVHPTGDFRIGLAF